MLSIGTLGPSRIRPRNGGETFLPTVTTKGKRLSPLQFSLFGQFKMKGMRKSTILTIIYEKIKSEVANWVKARA
jgi:hypothetical protein